MIYTIEKLANAYVLYRIKTVSVCLKKMKLSRISLIFQFNPLKVLDLVDIFCYLSLLIISKYFQTLIGDAHESYLDKIAIIDGEDPY